MAPTWYSRRGCFFDSNAAFASYDWSSFDVVKFFLYFENVAIRGKTDENMAIELLGILENKAFEVYYNGSLLE